MNFGLTVVVKGELYDKDMKLKQSFVKPTVNPSRKEGE